MKKIKLLLLTKLWLLIAIVTSLFYSCYPSAAFAAGTISGKVILQGRTNHSSPITFKLKNPGEATPVQTYNITTAPDGSYVISNVSSGIYNLSAKAPIFLSQNQVLIEVAENQTTSNINFNLLGGDCDNNNVVSMMDFTILRAAYGSKVGDPKWDARADFNGNNQIDMMDFSILNSNYGKSGFEPQISITSPQDGSIFSVSTITVSGTISDNNAQVRVNDITATVTNNTFTASGISLSEGQNRVSAIATNQYGNKNADLIIVVLDTVPPAVEIASPLNNSIVTGGQ